MATEAEAIRDILMGAIAETALETGNYAALPEGYSVESLEQFQSRPNRAKADHVFRDTASLVAYSDRFSGPASLAYSDPVKHRISVVFDDHSEAPGFREHRANFQGEFGQEYAAWRAMGGKWVGQVDAGLFLEDRAIDVVEPDAASIMEMVMTFDALKKVTFKQSTRLSDGRRQYTYSEENEARGSVTLPETITLLVPVFFGQEPERIKVRLRHRITDERLVFQFLIADRDAVEFQAFFRCEDAFATGLKKPVPLFRTKF